MLALHWRRWFGALALLALLGCDKGGGDASGTGMETPDMTPAGPVGPTERGEPDPEPTAQAEPDAASSQTAPAQPATGPVALTAEGSRFDPPVTEDRIPAGAWYCDMGTVHYASLAQGDGRCPICGMNLVQKAGGPGTGGGTGAGTGAGTGMHMH